MVAKIRSELNIDKWPGVGGLEKME